MENKEYSKEEIMDAASSLYSDPKIKNHKEISEVTFQFAKELETTSNIEQMCARYRSYYNRFMLLYIKSNVPKSLYKMVIITNYMSRNYRGGR